MIIDFACKTIKIDDIIKCSLNLSKAELKILRFFSTNSQKHYTTEEIAKNLNLNLSTVQRATKKMSEKKILGKIQKNLEKGGYIFEYKIKEKEEVKKIILQIVHSWTKQVEDKICNW